MRLGDVKGLLKTVFVSVILIELALAAVIIPRLIAWGFLIPSPRCGRAVTSLPQRSPIRGLFPSSTVFHLSLKTRSWCSRLGSVFFLGSIGFPVIYAISRAIRTARQRRQRRTWDHARLGMHARLTLSTTTLLLVVGALAIAALEWGNEKR